MENSNCFDFKIRNLKEYKKFKKLQIPDLKDKII